MKGHRPRRRRPRLQEACQRRAARCHAGDAAGTGREIRPAQAGAGRAARPAQRRPVAARAGRRPRDRCPVRRGVARRSRGAEAQRQLAAQAGQLRVRGLHHVEVHTRQPHLPDRVPCVAPPGPHGRGGQIVVAGGDQRQRAVQAARAVVARAFMHREVGAQHRQQVGPGFRVVEQVGCRLLRTVREETVC